MLSVVPVVDASGMERFKEEVASDETTPLVPKRRPDNDEARVVAPVTLRLLAVSVPVALMFEAVRLPSKKPPPLTESATNGDVVPMPTRPERYEIDLLGSNQYCAVVVDVLPMVTT
jgi:hypothetical protein